MTAAPGAERCDRARCAGGPTASRVKTFLTPMEKPAEGHLNSTGSVAEPLATASPVVVNCIPIGTVLNGIVR